MRTLKATSTVYSYYFPEVRRVIDRIVRRYPHEVFLRSVKPGLDDFHVPIIKKYARIFGRNLGGIDGFRHSYVVSGASEAIFHILAKLKTAEPKTPLYILHGEYQGYREYAKTLGVRIKEVTEAEAAGSYLPAGVFFISNPSARDGMILPGVFVESLLKRHRVVLDATYVGLTRPFVMNLRRKNIIAVLVSLSKPFGLYYYRIGFVFSRLPIASLEANKWFKNIFSLIITDKLLSTFRPGALWRKYAPLQKKVVMHLKEKSGITIEASDVLILGKISEPSARALSPAALWALSPYKRGRVYRLCLTPYFLAYEKNKTF